MFTSTTRVSLPWRRVEIAALLLATIVMLAQALPAQSTSPTNRVSSASCWINGYVLLKGSGLGGVSVSAGDGGGATTNSSGWFHLTVPYGWSGDVTASKVGYTFSPSSHRFVHLTTSYSGVIFHAEATTCVISGFIRTPDGNGLSGVTVSEEGGNTATTDPSGYYSLTEPYDWTGTVTPSKSGWTFVPPSTAYGYVGSNQDNENYTAVPPGWHIISGHVRAADERGVSDVRVAADNGGSSAITDSSGFYGLAVPGGWSGTVTAAKAGYALTPSIRSYNNVASDRYNEDCTALRQGRAITGRVLTSDRSGVPSVTVSANNGDNTTTTDPSGFYGLTVPEGWSGTVMLSRTGYGFNPPSRSYNGVTTDLSAQDYTARLAAVIYVNATATGSKDGTSWTNAFVCLQDALAKAAFGDSIWVAEGTYWPDLGRGQYLHDRASTFQLRSGVALYGGFPAGGDWRQRNPFAHQSILSGDIGQVGVAQDNCYHVVTAGETGLPALLDGCVITGGFAGDPKENQRRDRGAGLYCAEGGLQVRNCTFVGNSANHAGGGVCLDAGDATFINCIFNGNTANDGGALSRQGGTVALINCTIVANRSAWRAPLACPTLVVNSIVWGNQGRPDKSSYDELAQGCGILRPTVNFCCVEGWKEPGEALGGTGNFGRDPLFVNAQGLDGLPGTPDDDLRLRADSPCIGKGDNTAVPPEIRTDLEGKPRILGGTIDIGAYEFGDQAAIP